MTLPLQGEIWWAETEGLAEDCAASFDNLQRVRRAVLTSRAGDLGTRRLEMCAALRALADC